MAKPAVRAAAAAGMKSSPSKARGLPNMKASNVPRMTDPAPAKGPKISPASGLKTSAMVRVLLTPMSFETGIWSSKA
jgi:hypothetical protein